MLEDGTFWVRDYAPGLTPDDPDLDVPGLRPRMTDLPLADFLADRPPFYVIGALLGLTVIGVLATLNERMGALGGYSAVVRARDRADRRRSAGRPGSCSASCPGRCSSGCWPAETTAGDGYGWLTRTFTGSWEWVAAALLLGGGVLIGFGAQTAGGCTAGNGICGTALGSPAAFVATGDVPGGGDRRDLLHRRGDRLMGVRVAAVGFGAVFGFAIAWGQFTDPDRLREMLLLQDAYLYLMMATAVAVGFVGVRVLRAAARTRAGHRNADRLEHRAPGAPPRGRRGDLRGRLGGHGLVPGADRRSAGAGRVLERFHDRRGDDWASRSSTDARKTHAR